MTKRRVRLGSGLDPQKLADTIQQALESYAEFPGLSIDAHQREDGWLHLAPKAGQNADGSPTQMIGWLLTFGYPETVEPTVHLANLGIGLPGGVKLAAWEPHIYASFWVLPELASDEIAALAIAIVREVQAVPPDTHLEVALEFGV